jgi:hypothetical protein
MRDCCRAPSRRGVTPGPSRLEEVRGGEAPKGATTRSPVWPRGFDGARPNAAASPSGASPRRFQSPAPCFRTGKEAIAPLIQAASAALRARRVQPSKAVPHSGDGRLSRGLPSAGLQALPAGAAATPRFAVSCRTPLAWGG